MVNAAEIFQQVKSRLLNPEREMEIIGHVIENPIDQIEILTSLDHTHFSSMYHANIFSLIKEMFQNNRDISKKSVLDFIQLKAKTKELREMKKILDECLATKITDTVSNSIQLIRDLTKNRTIYYDVLVEGNRMFVHNEPTQEIIDKMSNALVGIELNKKEDKTVHIVQNVVDNIISPKLENKGLKSKITGFDDVFGGFIKDRYIAIGGESGQGKTAVVIDWIHRLSTDYPDQVAILFFSLEMSHNRVIERLISRDTGLSSTDLDQRIRLLTPAQKELVKASGNKIISFPLTIIYDVLTTTQMEMRTKKFAVENKGKHLVIIIDHLGLIQGKTDDIRVNTINASAMAKSFCTKYGATTIPLIQFTKEAESRKNAVYFHRPHLGFIAESGRIRQDADNIILLWRPETRYPSIHYGNDENWDTTNKLIMLNEKNRDGQSPTDIILDCDIKSNKLSNCSLFE